MSEKLQKLAIPFLFSIVLFADVIELHGLVFNSGDGREVPYIDCAAEGDFPTLIGNIHENPELIP